jgi:hypothetical protein
VRGEKTLARLASGFVFLLANLDSTGVWRVGKWFSAPLVMTVVGLAFRPSDYVVERKHYVLLHVDHQNVDYIFISFLFSFFFGSKTCMMILYRLSGHGTWHSLSRELPKY